MYECMYVKGLNVTASFDIIIYNLFGFCCFKALTYTILHRLPTYWSKSQIFIQNKANDCQHQQNGCFCVRNLRVCKYESD